MRDLCVSPRMYHAGVKGARDLCRQSAIVSGSEHEHLEIRLGHHLNADARPRTGVSGGKGCRSLLEHIPLVAIPPPPPVVGVAADRFDRGDALRNRPVWLICGLLGLRYRGGTSIWSC